MKESGKERFILTKSYEIAYALFRLAAPLKEADFSERLRAAGAALLTAISAEDYAAAGPAIQVMECLVKFAGDVNLVSAANADITLREIYALEAAIIELRNAAKSQEVDVAEIFSKPEIGAPDSRSAVSEPAIGNPAIAGFDSAAEQSASPEPAMINIHGSSVRHEHEAETAIEPSIRQSAILGRIRQSGNCRLKDIQDILPDTSERTIRYDLQTLLERHLIERVGTAGPSVFYRALER
jgi:DeoR-like helix-turn-helix domain